MGRAEPGSLLLRIASAALLAPVALIAAWLGPPILSLLVVLAAGVMGWEWARLCDGGRFARAGLVLVATELLGIGVAAAVSTLAGIAVLIAGAAILLGIAPRGAGAAARWSAFGALWIGLPCAALIWLAEDAATGRATVLWIFAVVWATDISAYAVGRSIGGPRLAPRWSPHKTWSGLIGGVAGAGLVGLGTARLLGAPLLAPVFWASLVLAVVEQLGDLAESAAKRRFGVKDTSRLIPGHGGFLDRLDGMLAVAAATAGMSLLGGASILAWR